MGKLSPASTEHLHITRAEEILNKESGWKALTGTTDFRVISESDDPKHKLAFDLFVDRVCGFVGSYYVTLQGQVDALVFAGGIGEKSALLRSAVLQQAGCLASPSTRGGIRALGAGWWRTLVLPAQSTVCWCVRRTNSMRWRASAPTSQSCGSEVCRGRQTGCNDDDVEARTRRPSMPSGKPSNLP